MNESPLIEYRLIERYWVGGSIGYYRTKIIETFKDLELAEKERENMIHRGIGSGVFYITKEKDQE